MSRPCFTPTGPTIAHRFPPPGPHGVCSPASIGTISGSESLTPILPHFVTFAWQYHVLLLIFRDLCSYQAQRLTLAGREVFVCRVPRYRLFTWRHQGLPGSWTTLVHMPRSMTPAKPTTLGLYRVVDAAFGATHHLSLDESCLSGLNHAAYVLAVYASQSGSLPSHARLASGWDLPLPGGGLSPTGLLRKVSLCSIHQILLSQALPGARADASKCLYASVPLCLCSVKDLQ